MGPDTYDLVSLLRDSYVDLPEQTVERADRVLPRAEGRRPDPEAAFRERFDVMALQRNLKALGTFGYQTTARRNPVYIQYIPRTLRYVRDNLDSAAAVRAAARPAGGPRRRVPLDRCRRRSELAEPSSRPAVPATFGGSIRAAGFGNVGWHGTIRGFAIQP